MKKLNVLMLLVLIITNSVILFNSCAPSKAVAEKSGALLWGENCNRCHNSPTLDQYSKHQWDIIVLTHMKRVAGLSDNEVQKIVGFLKQNKYQQ